MSVQLQLGAVMTPQRLAAIKATLQRIEERLDQEPAFSITSHLRVELAGDVVYDRHFRGPEVTNTFSVTKSVIATLVGVANKNGLMPDFDVELDALLGRNSFVSGTPAATQTIRSLLAMRRGAVVDGPYDMGDVAVMPSGQIQWIVSAPQVDLPGQSFAYDNAAAHLLSHVVSAYIGEPLHEFAAAELFEPLGITDWQWWTDPDGVPYGFAQLFLSAESLAKLGQLWLDGGRYETRSILNPWFIAAMSSPTARSVAPEDADFGWQLWIEDHGFFSSGWAGQSITVIPSAQAVIVTTGDPQYSLGPPQTANIPDGWRSARHLVKEHLVPVLVSS